MTLGVGNATNGERFTSGDRHLALGLLFLDGKTSPLALKRARRASSATNELPRPNQYVLVARAARGGGAPPKRLLDGNEFICGDARPPSIGRLFQARTRDPSLVSRRALSPFFRALRGPSLSSLSRRAPCCHEVSPDTGTHVGIDSRPRRSRQGVGRGVLARRWPFARRARQSLGRARDAAP